jgi:hypothetical protein
MCNKRLDAAFVRRVILIMKIFSSNDVAVSLLLPDLGRKALSVLGYAVVRMSTRPVLRKYFRGDL